MSARMVVIGGGLAGITAALTAADAGVEVTLLEGRPRLGGATFSLRRDDMWLDNGQHVFLRCCTEYIAFLERIGSADKVHLQRRMDVPVRTPWGTRTRLARSGLPAPLHLSSALARYPLLTMAGRARVGLAALALRRLDPADPALDEATFAAWLDRFGVTAREREAMWDLIGIATLNLPATEASLAMAVKVFRTGVLDHNDGADIGWSLVPLQELHGDASARALAKAGVRVRLRARVDALDAGAGGFAVHAGGERIEAEAVVLAVPHYDAARLLPAGALLLDDVLADPNLLTGLGTSPIVNLHVVYDRPVLDVPLTAGVGSPVQWMFDRSAGHGLAPGRYVAVSLSAATREIDLTSAQLRDRFIPELARVLPAARQARVERFVVTKERSATFRPAPGSGRLRPGPRTAIPGLALAGAWTATGWPATMEGAVRSGLSAAREALPHLGRTRAIPERTTPL
ncbi:phytoene dehydrogenase [Embleya scabrispora]|uniref:Phytoene dehydrogenase n=1 Tax=Embleya scabrispora TaxID=159449 RepID=A0A1T3NV28_9ACTN|nr:hydroxysqualene dehydroxylase HpnE [Embleya scabrispora]OPC80531.1 phytoene dehydrogenase [Embleya scabrispora]